jgi:hypothetical protein
MRPGLRPTSRAGGEGHTYPEPAVRFYGGRGEGFRALAVAAQHGLPVRAIRRLWTVDRRRTGLQAS